MYIRQRDGWRCAYRIKCFGQSLEHDKAALHTSHYQKRRHENVRFDPENADAACRACHRWVEDTVEGAKWLEQWKIAQLGEQRHALLLVRKQTYKQRDDKLDALYAKQLLRELSGV